MSKRIIYLLVFCLFSISGFSQSYWTELEFSKKIVKNLKVEFNPELRLLNDFKMDAYILEGGLSYKLHKYLTVAGYYRFENTWDYKKSTGAYKGQVKSGRLAFDAKSGFELKRFDFQFRLRYTNGADFDQAADESNDSYFRYKAKIDYDIKGCKFVPSLSAEAFHDLHLDNFDKIRYTLGLNYPINNKNDIGLFYRLQDYTEAGKETLNILGLGYSFKF